MNRFVKTGLLMVLAFVLLGAYRYVSAHEERSQAGKAGPPPPVFNMSPSGGIDVAATKHALSTTYLTSGTLGGGALPPGIFTPIDAPQTISCPGTSGTCTIVADHWIELIGAGGSGNLIDGCLYVDGVADSNCSFIEGETNPDGTWSQTSSSHATSGVLHGTHTVQTFGFCAAGCNAAYFQVSYRIYKP
jgi:hypothetical protein